MNIDQTLYSLEGIILREKVTTICVHKAGKGTYYAIVPRIAENKNTIIITLNPSEYAGVNALQHFNNTNIRVYHYSKTACLVLISTDIN